jgi:hypothetical protein
MNAAMSSLFAVVSWVWNWFIDRTLRYEAASAVAVVPRWMLEIMSAGSEPWQLAQPVSAM